MKIVAPDTFLRAREGKIEINEIKTFLSLDKEEDDSVGINADYVLGWWNYCLADKDPDRSDPNFQTYRHYLFRYSVSRQAIVPAMAHYLDSFQSSA